MSSKRLFGNDIRPACKYCGHVLQLLGEDKMLCDKKGVVPAANKCRAFIYDPLKRVPKKPRPLEKIEETEFEL